jgi:filamentous hemagglutinin family protein
VERNRKKQPAQRPSLFYASLPRRALHLAILAILYPSFSYANPDGAQVVSGQVSIDTATPGVTTITNSPNAIINWQNFSIAQNEITRFIQQNGQSAVLNRIIGQNPSEILGQLTSNGKVFLINPNGIVFGAGATIDTQGLIASSLNLSDQDFLSGNYHFMAGSNAGNILNEGIIRAGKDGNIILIAPQIQNNGIIKSDGGSITLAAGQELTITNLDDPDIRFQIQAPTDSALNLGKLLTEGGAISVFASTIKHSGEINADSVQVDKQGNIRLVAQQDITLAADSKISANNSQGDAGSIHIDSKTGTTLAQGSIEAQATQTGKGGDIELLGERVGVLDQAKIDASGANGGGQVLIGGDYQGKNADVHNANMTYVGKNTAVKADAKTHGNGGKVIAWADNTARVHGSLSAKGGALSGNGGFIETSGHQYLDVEGIRVNASAANGAKGTWLLDPNNIQIIHATSSGSDSNIPAVAPFAPPSDSANSIISDYTINQALSGYANVTLTTANTGAAGTGDILFDGSYGNIVLSKNSADAFSTTLTFNAFNNIKFLSSSNTTFQTYGAGSTGSLTVVFNPTNGKVEVDTGATLNLNGQGTSVEAQLAGGRVWENNGTINMLGNSVIRPYLSTPSTFDNQAGGVLNINSTGSWSFLSTQANQDGIFNNSGTINVNSNTSWEAMFRQTAGGILNLHNGLSMQHLDVAAGTINIDSGKTLWISENHAGLNKFDGAYINGPGRLQVGNAISSYTPTVTFNNVNTNGLTVLREQQGALAFTGANTFADTKFFANGTTNIDWAIPAATYIGNTEWWAKGDITLNNNLSTSGNLTLGAGWNANISTPTSTSAGLITNNAAISAGNVFFNAGKMALANGTISGLSSVNLLSANAIDLGTVATDMSATLELSTAELNTIYAPILRIGDFNSGAIDIKSALALAHISNTLNLTSGGAITQQAGATIAPLPGLAISGSSVTLTEANGAGVISGQATGPGGQFNYTAANPLNITTVDGISGITTNNGNVSLTTTYGDIHIPAQIKAGTGTVNLKATSGSVYGTGTSPDIIAGNVYISAYNNIWGAGGLHIEAPLISQLSATAGFIDIKSFSSSTTLGTVSAYDDITIRASSPLTVNGGITSTIGDIHLSATALNINNLINAGSAEMELEADTLTWDRAGHGQVIGNLVNIETYTDGRPITVGGSCIGGPGTCLSVTELWRVKSPTIGIGGDLVGDIYVSGITNGVSTLTDRNAATTRIGLISNGGVTQSMSAIDVQDLGIEANGEVMLNAANKISNLAATTGGYNLTFNNAQGFNIIQMSGGATPSNYYDLEYNIVGVDTCSSYNCGNLTLSSTGAIIEASAPITAGNLAIKSGGDVHLADLALSSGALDISAGGNIYSRSMGVSQMTRLNATSGWIDAENIGGFMLGSAAITPGTTVVNAAGNIMIKALSPLTVNGAVASSGGSVSLTASNGDTLTINAPISAPNGISLKGGTLTGSYADSYLQYFNSGTSTASTGTSGTNTSGTSNTTETLKNAVTNSIDQTTAGVLGTTPQLGGQLLADESSNSTGESTDLISIKGKNSKQCTK